MRAPSPSFKSTIALYRKSLIAGNPPQGARYHLVMGVLDRWEQHPDVEAIWNKIKPKLPDDPAAAGLFIASILKASFVANDVERMVHELPRAKKDSSLRAKRFLAEENFERAKQEVSWLSDVSQGRDKLF